MILARHRVTREEAAVEAATEQLLKELEEYKAVLQRIEQFGHSHGHGRGYTCANWAKESLDKFNEIT